MNTSLSNFGGSLASGLLSGIGAALTLSALAFVFQEPLAQELSQLRPTCDLPSGLVPMDSAKIKAKGPVSPSHAESGPEDVLDGYAGSLWVPPSVHPPGTHGAMFAEGSALLALEFPQADVRLVCVNNGMASSTFAYKNHGKVKTIRSWTDGDASGAVSSTLNSEPSERMQRFQMVRRNIGPTDQLFLQLDDAYFGETLESFDPDHCGQPSERVDVPGGETVQLRFEQGCIVAAAPVAGLSEVVLYEDAQQSWAQRWIPFWP